MAKHAFEKFINKAASGAKKKEAIRQEKRKLKQDKYEGRNAKDETRSTKHEVRNTKQEVRISGNWKQETGNRKQDKPSDYKPQTTNYKQPKTKNRKLEKYEARSAKQEAQSTKQEVRNTKDEVRNAKPEAQNPKPEARITGNRKLETENWKQNKPSNYKQQTTNNKRPETANRKLETGNWKQNKPSNHKPQTTNYKRRETGNRKPETNLMPLNKFIAHAGICARREAAEIVKQGKVQVNGAVVYEPGSKVSPGDKVSINGRQVFLQKNLVYILLNKPKDYLTTAKDPEGRKTVFDLIKHATKERVYPVGRLDRNTTGVLLMTNDGELAQKLTHPSFQIKKLYEVKLDKPLAKKDFDSILRGVTLEDGFVKADALAYVDHKDKSIIGIEIHSGRNRIVRRLFEYLQYDIKNLDRVMFANLTKKNVDRGKWRYLNEKEIRLLKYMNQSFVKKAPEPI